NRNKHFRFAVRVRLIILRLMAHPALIPCISILPALQAFAADQTASAIADKGKQTLDWWKDRTGHFVETHGPALFGAFLVLAAGVYAGRLIGNFASHWLEQKPIEPPVRLLMVRIARLLVVVMALVIALGTAGVDITALVAGIGVAGVGIGLAMQGV